MPEYFIHGNTFAAPFVSERFSYYEEAPTAAEALVNFASGREKYPGVYAANAYGSADSFHKGEAPLAKWRSNHAIAAEGANVLRSGGPGHAEIDGKTVVIEDPYKGRSVP